MCWLSVPVPPPLGHVKRNIHEQEKSTLDVIFQGATRSCQNVVESTSSEIPL